MKALLIVDVLNDFCPGGKMEVKDGDRIISKINKLSNEGDFDIIIAIQDWHPKYHVSFASSHGVDDFTLVNGKKVWPDHCIQGTVGAELRPNLNQDNINIIVRKGLSMQADSYSGFQDDDGKKTGLEKILQGCDFAFITGIATDYCVAATTIDALTVCDHVFVVEDACAGVDPEDSKKALQMLEKAGARIVKTDECVED